MNVRQQVLLKLFTTGLFCLFYFWYLGTLAQSSSSLNVQLENAPHDSVRCKLLMDYIENEPEDQLWEPYNKLLLQISLNQLAKTNGSASKKFFQMTKAEALNNFGYMYNDRGETSLSLEFYTKGVTAFKESGDEKGLGNCLNNLAYVYHTMGKIPEALSMYHRALAIQEAINDPEAIGLTLHNIAYVYQNFGDNEKAIDYYKKSLALRKKAGDKNGIAAVYNNIGAIYVALKNGAKAIEYHSLSLQMREEIGDKRGIGTSLNNLGTSYRLLGEVAKALDYYKRSEAVHAETQNKEGLAYSYQNMGVIYLNQSEMKLAEQYFIKGLNLGKELGYPLIIKNVSMNLYKLYVQTKRWEKALDMYELTVKMKDSLGNAENKKATIKAQLQYEYEKKTAADSVKSLEEKKVTAALLKSEKTQRYSLFTGLLLVAVFALFMVNRFRITNKQKKIIEEQKIEVERQKTMVELKQKEVLDSIHYAKRIQSALMSTEFYITRVLENLSK